MSALALHARPLALTLSGAVQFALLAVTGSAATTMPPQALAEVRGPLVVAVGDIACSPARDVVTATRCQQAATARQALGYHPALAFDLGDNQYERGSLRAYRRVYDRSWGALRAITRPVPGNHEYRTPGARGYYAYFAHQQPGPPGYYAFDVQGWRVYALNSNCNRISCHSETRWLRRQMNGHRRACSLMMMHHPLYSSGLERHRNTDLRPLWRVALRHHTDLALAGHDHDYERFRPMDATGHVIRRGIRSFVVGTGGKNLRRSRVIRHGSVIFSRHRAGVLALRLGHRDYAWQYKTIDGLLVDSGTARCH